MAKSKSVELVSIRDIFKEVASSNKRFELADESTSLKDKGFISTGSMALNSIMSGNIYQGIKKGGITAFAGRESTGKTFICMNIMREAQKDGIGVILCDAEGAYTNTALKQIGINPEEVLFQPSDTIHNFQVDICNTLKLLNEQYPDKEWLVILDSLVNLITEKEMEDTKKGEIKSDQGQRAKQLKAASRMVQKAISAYNGTLVLTNHTYESPGAYPGIPPEEIFSGGSGFLYMAHQIVFLKKYEEKEDLQTSEGGKKKKQSTGIRVVAITKKNRCCPAGKHANFYINYKKGLLKYPGLLDYAIQYGFIEDKSGWYYIKHLDKKVRGSQLYSSEIWEPILEELNENVKKDFSFPDPENDEMLKQIEDDAESTEDTEDEDIDIDND